jgi:hypothetical protein
MNNFLKPFAGCGLYMRGVLTKEALDVSGAVEYRQNLDAAGQ